MLGHINHPYYRPVRGADYYNRNRNLRLSLTRILANASPRDWKKIQLYYKWFLKSLEENGDDALKAKNVCNYIFCVSFNSILYIPRQLLLLVKKKNLIENLSNINSPLLNIIIKIVHLTEINLLLFQAFTIINTVIKNKLRYSMFYSRRN